MKKVYNKSNIEAFLFVAARNEKPVVLPTAKLLTKILRTKIL